MRKEIDIGYLKECFVYEASTGHLRWKERPSDHFGSQHVCDIINSRCAGKLAGSVDSNGYISVHAGGVSALAHRVAWAITHGRWPNGNMDHINGNRSDNRIANLREADASENAMNRKRDDRNTSGRTGVYRCPTGKWKAQIGVGKKVLYLGRFSSFEEAVAARKAASILHGFHENHGRDENGHQPKTIAPWVKNPRLSKMYRGPGQPSQMNDPKYFAKVVEMKRKGIGYPDISKKLGKSVSWIYNHTDAIEKKIAELDGGKLRARLKRK